MSKTITIVLLALAAALGGIAEAQIPALDALDAVFRGIAGFALLIARADLLKSGSADGPGK